MSKAKSGTATKATPPAPPKPARGRPRLGTAVSSRVIGIRVTEAELAELSAYAEAKQTTVTELLRPAMTDLLQAARSRK